MTQKNISQELKIEYKSVDSLKEWDKNPRSINSDAFDRLKAQITRHGVYKPLIVDQDGVIIGGNMRYKALKSLGVDKVSVIVHHCKDDAERIEIALSDNDRAGYYNETELHELVQLNDIDGELYSIDLTESKTIEEIINAEPTEQTEGGEVDTEGLLGGGGEKTHICPRCSFEFTDKEEQTARQRLEE